MCELPEGLHPGLLPKAPQPVIPEVLSQVLLQALLYVLPQALPQEGLLVRLQVLP